MVAVGHLSSPSFDIPGVPPFTPGTSPFRVAGVLYRGLADFVRLHVDGGMPAVAAHMDDARLAAFVSQPFAATARYDAVPLPYLGAAVARARGVTFERQIQDSNRWAEENVGVVYRALLGIISAETVALAVPKAAAIAHDFGKARTTVAGPRLVRGVRTGVPHVLCRWLALSNGYYLEQALLRAGAQRAGVRFEGEERDGEVEGHPTYALPFEIEWQ